MSLDVARYVQAFCQSNNISRAEIMGGEFFVHPQWEEVLDILTKGLRSVRIVSNGDWAASKRVTTKVLDFFQARPQCHFGISRDRWHTNKFVESAAKHLDEAGIPYCVGETPPEAIIPVGRSWQAFGDFYSMFGCYCHDSERQYSFMIDEEGEIYKCVVGKWPYANVSEHLKGGFASRFQAFNKRFYGIFLSNCVRCAEAESRNQERLAEARQIWARSHGTS